MKNLACEPCSKRKVKCDREEPCSNCKRRKKDHCTYAETSPHERIRRLEALVQDLGGRTDGQAGLGSAPADSTTPPIRSQDNPQQDQRKLPDSSAPRTKDPVLMEENGQSFYLESRVWSRWLGNEPQDGKTAQKVFRNPFRSRNAPEAFQSVFKPSNHLDFAAKHPSRDQAVILWSNYRQRIEPVVKISFGWALEDLHRASLQPETREKLTNSEHALLFALYLASALSLTDTECRRDLYQSKALLIMEYQSLCEEAVARNGLLSMTDITMLKALTLYLVSGADRLSTQSLWSLMGLVVRNAEKFGIHRDGTILGLSPFETEDRRRLWWQMQHIDLVLAVRGGLTPLTMMAAWDAKLPLNIEDEDIKENATTFPPEREGLTSMSYCLYTYWVIDQQRGFFAPEKEMFSLSWHANHPSKDAYISRLESGLNTNFLQYCDPIKPMDTLIQICARFLIVGMRLRSLHPAQHQGNMNEEHREKLVSAAMQCLEYNVALHSQPSLRRFQWLTKKFFPWHAFMCVIVELAHQTHSQRTQRIWDLLIDLYSTNEHLTQLSEDPRCVHAAELVVTAWKARHNNKTTITSSSVTSNATASYRTSIWKPDFVTNLESQLLLYRTGPLTAAVNNIDDAQRTATGAPIQQPSNGIGTLPFEPITPESFIQAEQEVNATFSFDFQDVDWDFWSSIG